MLIGTLGTSLLGNILAGKGMNIAGRCSTDLKIKDDVYVINLDEYSNIGAHWIVLYAFNKNISYFDSF